MNWIELVMITAVGVIALMAHRRGSSLEREIEFVRRRNQDRVYELSDEIEKLTAEVRTLRARVHASGELRFTPNLLIDELDDIHPDATSVLASFQIGGCGGCGGSCSCGGGQAATLAEAAAEKGLDVNQVLAALNALLQSPEAVQEALAKIGPGGLLQIQTRKPDETPAAV